MTISKVLIGGCSSVGKTTVAAGLSEYLKIPHYSLDGIRKGIEHPVCHMLDDENVWNNDTKYLVNIIKQMGDQLSPAIEKWCLNIENGILEGEGIEPGIIRKKSRLTSLKTVFIIETDFETLLSTLMNRSKKFRKLTIERQAKVISMNVEYSGFLKSEAIRTNQPWVHSRPWHTLQKRIISIIE